MKKIFYGIIFSFMLLFVYWTCLYFIQGYNLTDNVRHLDLYSMIQNLNNLRSYSDSVDLLFNNLNRLINTTDTWVNSNVSFRSGSGFKVILNAINFIVSTLSKFALLGTLINNFIVSIMNFATMSLGFIFNLARFILFPIFI